MGPSSQYFDSLFTCCMRPSREDCSVDDNYLVQNRNELPPCLPFAFSSAFFPDSAPADDFKLCYSCCRHICETHNSPRTIVLLTENFHRQTL